MMSDSHSADSNIHPKLKDPQNTSPRTHSNLDAIQGEQELLGLLTYEKITKCETLTLQCAQ